MSAKGVGGWTMLPPFDWLRTVVFSMIIDVSMATGGEVEGVAFSGSVESVTWCLPRLQERERERERNQ